MTQELDQEAGGMSWRGAQANTTADPVWGGYHVLRWKLRSVLQEGAICLSDCNQSGIASEGVCPRLHQLKRLLLHHHRRLGLDARAREPVSPSPSPSPSSHTRRK